MLGTTFALDHWAWWILALVLFVLELILPGVFFLWLGLAAALTGFIALIVLDLPWQGSLTIFAALSAVSVLIGRRVWKPRDLETGAIKIGQVVTLETAIVDGAGTIEAGDGLWLVEGPDLPAGARVRVTGVMGAQLLVEAAADAATPDDPST
jgi:membrane protein implicated in regulation of membrane protease activity